MTLSEYRNSPYWKAAMDLAPTLVRLADDLPGSEDNGLGSALRLLAVDLPASIASDLHTGSNTRTTPLFKLIAALDLVDRVYPALDTAGARAAADALGAQILADAFSRPSAAPEAPEAPEAKPAPASIPAAAPAPVSVPVLEAPAEAAPAPAPAPTTVAVTPAGDVNETHV